MRSPIIPLLPLFCLAALPAGAMTLKSTDIREGEPMDKVFSFNGFGCSGDNRSPQLSWQDLPAGTKSVAITAYDPDAPTGSGWWHWLVVDLPAGTSELSANAGAKGSSTLPAGARQMRNDYGAFAWGGMCPPPGDKPHRYIFTVHALSVDRIDVPDDAPAALTGFMVNANTLAKASFTATYGR